MQLFGIVCLSSRQTVHAIRHSQTGRQTAARPSGGHADLGGGNALRISPSRRRAGATGPDKAASELPSAPAPVADRAVDSAPLRARFSKPAARLLGNPINMFRPTTIAKASFVNSVRLNDLVKDGKIYLSLSDAIALAIENNYDIAIARYDLDIADTDILRTRTGACAAGRALRPGHRHTGRFDLDVDHRRRSRRNNGRLGRRGFRRLPA